MLNRRDLLSSSLLFFLAASSSCASNLIHVSPKKKILILGAGISGLRAARLLVNSGFDVEILEARDRAGGRVHSGRTHRGEQIEIGANWLHGLKNNPLRPYVQHRNLSLTPTELLSPVILTENKVISPMEVERVGLVYDQLMDKMHAIKNIEGAADRDWESFFDEVIQASGLKNDKSILRHMSRVRIDDGAGAEASELSAARWDFDQELEGGDHLISGGFQQVIQDLAKDLKIHLNTVIKKIIYSEQGITAIDQNHKTWSADHIIVTAPLGVLKARTIQFEPDLPNWKWQAIDATGFGHYEKVFISLDRHLPVPRTDWIEFLSSDKKKISSFLYLPRANKTSLLVGLVWGQVAQEISSVLESELKMQVEFQLQKMFQQKIQVNSVMKTNWSNDPYSLGSFSFPRVHETTATRAALGLSIGKSLHFAGEACQTDFIATVHAAYFSGERLAQKLIREI